jgi:hypothetical protein
MASKLDIPLRSALTKPFSFQEFLLDCVQTSCASNASLDRSARMERGEYCPFQSEIGGTKKV